MDMWDLAQNMLGNTSLLHSIGMSSGKLAALHFFPHFCEKMIKFFKFNTIFSWSFFPISICWDTPKCFIWSNMWGYTFVEMLDYLTDRILLCWVIVTHSLVVQKLESQSVIRNEHQHLLLIKQSLNATAVQNPYKSPCLVNLCLPT